MDEAPKASSSRVYLASALSNFELNRRVALAISSLGYVCYLPQDESFNREGQTAGEIIAKRNKEELDKCDCAIAVFRSMGLDTSWEIGYASGLQKPCFLICTIESAEEARRSPMPFHSVLDLILVPDWAAPDAVLADNIGRALERRQLSAVPCAAADKPAR